MINIGMMCPGPTDATSYYRAWGPFTELRKQFPELNINLIDFREGHWNHIKNLDVAFLQRPNHKNHIEAARVCKSLGVPVWVDFDDDLMNVPRENPQYSVYSTTKNNVRGCAEMADIVTASMPGILKELRVDGEVVENAVGPEWGEADLSQAGREKIVVWRGSQSHQGELLAERDNFLAQYEVMKNDGWKFVFLGWNPWFLTEHMNESDYHFEPFKDIFTFVDEMKALRPRIFWFPLTNNVFNRSKSLNCWEDATHFGAQFVCPEFYKTGPNVYRSLVEAAAVDEEDAEKRVLSAWEDVVYLEDANYKRKQILEKLIGGRS